jgi:hypothetical protein
MRIREFTSFTPLRLALGALVLAAALTIWALASAFRAPEPAMPAQTASVGPLALAPVPAAAAADIGPIVDEDIFSPDRAAPDEPFHMPGDQSAHDVAPKDQPSVLGTAVGPHGYSFATAQIGKGKTQIVRVGDKIGPFTVAAIERGHVVFTGPRGDRLDVAALTESTQEPTNVSLDTVTAPIFPFGRNGRAGRTFFGGGGNGAGRGRRGASPDSIPFD